ncbi:large low complexity [Cryptosporidium sp. chipmunk genotype I]|uniref:large low complexity n=1 Tax=Cryptosporidium sp. chipmunk genotype I TaxID=1280935 RepID=UPI00351A6C86|nr:large low complexity [Cryptosporidium sp. chipmunk genotype I]
MSVNIYTSIIDHSSIKVLFVKTQVTDTTLFDDVIKQIQNSIIYYSSNINQLKSNPKCDYINRNRSIFETKPFKINTVYTTICSYNNKTNLPKSFICIDHIVIFITYEKYSNNQMLGNEASTLGQPFIYRVGIDIIDGIKKEIKFNCEDQNGIRFNSIDEFAENVILNIFCKFNSIINKYIDKGYDKIMKTDSLEDKILDNIRYRVQIAGIYLTLGFPISSAMYYNSIVELIEDYDLDLVYYLAHCFEGQAALLYNFYSNSENSLEWWEVVSNSLNSFIQDLPTPIQVSLQSINYNSTNHNDSTYNIQSRKQIFFDAILKKLDLSLNLLWKTYNLTNGIILSDNNLKLNYSHEFSVSIYELIIKKSRFLIENFISYFHLDRKIIIDFLDPFVHLNIPPEYSRNDLYNYAMFLIGCAEIYFTIRSKRRVGVILIKLSQLFNQNKIYNHSYYISCAAYQWYLSIYSGNNHFNQLQIIQNLAAQILKEDDNYSTHTQCALCNISNNSNILLGNNCTLEQATERKLDIIFEKHYVPGKLYLENNYLQYLSIYQHDLSLCYSVFITNGNSNIYQDLEYSNTHYELLACLKPFVNSFVCYGVHSMLQAYRKFYMNTIDLQRLKAYPSRYEMLALILMIESSVLFGCASRSATVLLLLLDKIVYFPPIYDFDTLKIIQSKCIDSLSIISNTIQLPIIRAPYYSVTNNKNRGYTSIESLDHLFNTSLHTTHLLLIFDVTFEQSRLNTDCYKCSNEITLSSIFNAKINNYCSNCESEILKIDNFPWIFCKASKITFFSDSKFIFQPEFKWVPLKENNSAKLPILTNSKVNQSNLFLYNPFEKKVENDLKETFIRSKSQAETQNNIIWQAEKQYTIYVSLFNPFLIPIILDCFSVIIEGEVKCDISPVSVVIPPSPRFSTLGEVKVAIVVIPKNPGNLNIIGVTYKFSGINFVNFGSKLALFHNKNYLKQYLNVFVVPNISNDDIIFWEKNDKQKQNLLINNNGKVVIKSKKKLTYESEKKIKLLSSEVFIDQIETTTNEIFSLENIIMKDDETIITVECSNIHKINRYKLLVTHWIEIDGKIIISSQIFDLFSNIPPFAKITNISLIPKLNFQPVYLDLNNKWKVDKIWVIFTLENNSRVYPIELSFRSNLLEGKKVLLLPEKKSYRWVFETTIKSLIELRRDPSLLYWKAFFPNILFDNELKLIADGNLTANLFIPEFLSRYEFCIEIKCNGKKIGNKQVIPVNSIVNIEIFAISERKSKCLFSIFLLSVWRKKHMNGL